uniref:Protein kinase domain-containing protein n=1 Tax=Periophthalmus magnuspinnatus TaxID=409849 RepID=A0A3B4A4X3_9GOBI
LITQKEIDLTVDSMISGDFGSFQIKEIKGEGVCGLVARCIDLSTNKDVAVKISKSHLSVTRHEAKLLRDLRHVSKDKNIVEFITSFMYQGHYCLVMEHLDQSLFDLMISRRCKPLHISHICYITEQLLVTFKELAKRKLIHGDLKPDNIMLVNHKLEPFKIKLIDFGLSTTVRSVLPGYVFQPIGYRAPEVTLGATFNQAIDMWGLGCVLAFLYMKGLFTNRYFTKRCDRYELCSPQEYTAKTGKPNMMQLHPKPVLEAEKKKTMQFFDLLNQLLHVNPAKRITPEKALKHPFITQKAHTQKTFCCCVTPNKDKNTSSGSNSKEKICTAGTRQQNKESQDKNERPEATRENKVNFDFVLISENEGTPGTSGLVKTLKIQKQVSHVGKENKESDKSQAKGSTETKLKRIVATPYPLQEQTRISPAYGMGAWILESVQGVKERKNCARSWLRPCTHRCHSNRP